MSEEIELPIYIEELPIEVRHKLEKIARRKRISIYEVFSDFVRHCGNYLYVCREMHWGRITCLKYGLRSFYALKMAEGRIDRGDSDEH